LALSASLIASKLAKRSVFPNTEEIAIVALFKNMGSLLVATFDEKLYRETMALVTNGTHNKTQASFHTIGCSFESLTEIAMREWQIPNNIINATKLLPSKMLVVPKSRQEWMQQATEFSESAALLVLQADISTRAASEEILLNQFGATLYLDQTQLDTLIINVTNETRELSNLSRLSPKPHNKDNSTHTGGVITSEDSLACPKYPSGKPYDAVEQLKRGIQDITDMTASTQYEINDLVLKVLHVLHHSLSFHFTTLCLKDVQTNQFKARNSLGKDKIKIQKKFIFTNNSSHDLFNLALKRNIDLSIANTDDPKTHDMLPRWHKKGLSKTKSFVILPLVIKEEPLGFIYADRLNASPEGFSSDEMKLIKALKKQVITAFSS
ncbi:MAG: HDOD domain-containing protein, partial [Nitrosomonas sp.]|nr:HDOD domain-containing protein [Nitrosomonas sp.]